MIPLSSAGATLRFQMADAVPTSVGAGGGGSWLTPGSIHVLGSGRRAHQPDLLPESGCQGAPVAEPFLRSGPSRSLLQSPMHGLRNHTRWSGRESCTASRARQASRYSSGHRCSTPIPRAGNRHSPQSPSSVHMAPLGGDHQAGPVRPCTSWANAW